MALLRMAQVPAALESARDSKAATSALLGWRLKTALDTRIRGLISCAWRANVDFVADGSSRMAASDERTARLANRAQHAVGPCRAQTLEPVLPAGIELPPAIDVAQEQIGKSVQSPQKALAPIADVPGKIGG